MLKDVLLPRIALTPGEPAGIGPDIVLRLAQKNCSAQLIAFASPELLEERAKILNVPIILDAWQPGSVAKQHIPGHLFYYSSTLGAPCIPGNLDTRNANYVLDTLSNAARFALSGDIDAVVTGPVQKSCLVKAGNYFPGHTEFFAQKVGELKTVMMLVAGPLRVALATTHLPLAEVPRSITQESLLAILTVLHEALIRQFNVADPVILVCGLNPHAGEQGHLGREEIDTMIPVLEKLRKERGMRLEGPIPADTAFIPKNLSSADAVLAMYHDQGLPVLKHVGFGKAVNVTLGLPFVRTSVDHGTALDLAGTGVAQEGSLDAAVKMAIILSSSSSFR